MCKSMSPLEISLQLHGHFCPELLIGVRLAELAKTLLSFEQSGSQDYSPSPFMAVAESNSCIVDALQASLGCTTGKGNLLIRNGKIKEYSIFNQITGRGISVRLLDVPEIKAKMDRFADLSQNRHLSQQEIIEKEELSGVLFEGIMTLPVESLFVWKALTDVSELLTEKQKHNEHSICACPAMKSHFGELQYA